MHSTHTHTCTQPLPHSKIDLPSTDTYIPAILPPTPPSDIQAYLSHVHMCTHRVLAHSNFTYTPNSRAPKRPHTLSIHTQVHTHSPTYSPSLLSHEVSVITAHHTSTQNTAHEIPTLLPPGFGGGVHALEKPWGLHPSLQEVGLPLNSEFAPDAQAGDGGKGESILPRSAPSPLRTPLLLSLSLSSFPSILHLPIPPPPPQ